MKPSRIQQIEQHVHDFIRRYELVREQDSRIFCAVSGGKDSSMLLYLMNRFFPGRVQAITFNPHIPDYSDTNLNNIRSFCQQLQVPLHELSMKEQLGVTLQEFKEILDERYKRLNYCSICGVLKRYLLNHEARRQQASVIATGHNQDDVVQSLLMNLLRGKPQLSTRLGPVSGVVDDPRFIKRIKPLYCVPESDVVAYSQAKEFPVYYGTCPFSHEAYRRFLQKQIETYRERDPAMLDNMQQDFLDYLGILQSYYASAEMPASCVQCGEPAQQEMCAACHMLKAASLL